MFVLMITILLATTFQGMSAAVVTVGSVTDVLQVSTVNFLEADMNSIIGFTWIQDQLSFENSNTQCIYSSLGKISGDIELNDGTITLTEDMTLHGDANFVSLGTISGNGQTILFPAGLNSLPAGTLILENVTLYFFNDLTIDCSILIKGDCSIIGSAGVDLTFSSNAEIVLDDDATLSVKQVCMKGISGSNVRCSNANGVIKLFDSKILLTDDYSFDTGKLEFYDSVVIAGAHLFSYESDQTSLIAANAQLVLEDDINFRLGRFDGVTTVEPLEFFDHTSRLVNDNSTITSSQYGVNFLKGTLVCTGEVKFYREGLTAQTGIVFGDGINASNDFYVYFKGGSLIEMNQGYLVYNNVAPDGFKTRSRSARIIRKAGSSLLAQQNMSVPALTMELEPDVLVPLQLASGKTITFLNTELDLPTAKFNLLGTLINPTTQLLSGNNKLFLTKGTVPAYIAVQNGNNLIGGNGALSGKILLSDLYAWLIWALNGLMKNDVELNGGTLIMQSDLTFANGSVASGGTIQLGENRLRFAPDMQEITENILFNGTSGSIELRSDVILNSTLTITGQVTFNGSGHNLVFGENGEIIVAPNSSLRLKDITLQDMTDNCLRCLDNSGEVILDYVSLYQKEDISFAFGSLSIISSVRMNGNQKIFNYTSTQPFTINSEAKLKLNDQFIFNYAPSNAANDTFIFEDENAQLALENASLYVGSQGIALRDGLLQIYGNSEIKISESIPAGAVEIGSGVAEENCAIVINPSATLNLLGQTFDYKNTSQDLITMAGDRSQIIVATDSCLRLFNTLSLGNGFITFEDQSSLQLTSGATLLGSVLVLGDFTIEEITV